MISRWLGYILFLLLIPQIQETCEKRGGGIMALDKKNVIVLIEYIAELLMLFALYTLSEIDHISFGRYAFLFSMLYIMLRNKGHNSRTIKHRRFR